MSRLHSRIVVLFLLLTFSFTSPAQAQGTPDDSPSFFYCNRGTHGLWPFLQDLFNDITCPINNSIYFFFILAAVCSLFIIISSSIRNLRNRNATFFTTANIVSVITVFLFIIVFYVQYDPPYYYFPGFSREEYNVEKGESFLDCEKDTRFFIHFFVNFSKGFFCPIENLIYSLIILSAIYISTFRIQSIRRALKNKMIRRDIANIENTVQKLESGQTDNETIQRITDELRLLKAETLTTKPRRTVLAEIADILSFILAFLIFLMGIMQKR